jgi:hypothetical protein
VADHNHHRTCLRGLKQFWILEISWLLEHKGILSDSFHLGVITDHHRSSQIITDPKFHLYFRYFISPYSPHDLVWWYLRSQLRHSPRQTASVPGGSPWTCDPGKLF